MHCGRPTDSVPARYGPESPAAALKPARATVSMAVVLLDAEFLNRKQEQSRNSGAAAAAAAAEPAWNSQLDADQQADCCGGDGGGGGGGRGEFTSARFPHRATLNTREIRQARKIHVTLDWAACQGRFLLFDTVRVSLQRLLPWIMRTRFFFNFFKTDF